MAIVIHLSPAEATRLEHSVRTGTRPVREVTRAWILLKSHARESSKNIARALRVTPKTISKIRKRYRDEGLDAALAERPRPGPPRKVTPDVEVKITALACEEPPAGRAHVTIERIREQLEGRFKVRLSFGSIQHVLKVHELKPWKKRAGASPRSRPGSWRGWTTC